MDQAQIRMSVEIIHTVLRQTVWFLHYKTFLFFYQDYVYKIHHWLPDQILNIVQCTYPRSLPPKNPRLPRPQDLRSPWLQNPRSLPPQNPGLPRPQDPRLPRSQNPRLPRSQDPRSLPPQNPRSLRPRIRGHQHIGSAVIVQSSGILIIQDQKFILIFNIIG